MNKSTIIRGIRAYRDLMSEIAERQKKAEKIREWLGEHADQFDDEVDGQRVTVKAATRVVVDNRAIRVAASDFPAVLKGLTATYSVPAGYEPDRFQKQFITTKPAPTAIKFYEVKS